MIKDFSLEIEKDPQDIALKYFEAINKPDKSDLYQMYHPQATHFTRDQTLQGADAIRNWYEELFQENFPNSTFYIKDQYSSEEWSRFTWMGTSSEGYIDNGVDVFSLESGKIKFHYSHYSIN